jgi:hypothetical protein
VQFLYRFWAKCRRQNAAVLAGLALVGWAAPLHAQTTVSVPFPKGFIGSRGNNAQDATNVTTFASLGISRMFFMQSSPTNVFVSLQGNDIAGTLRFVGTNGQILDVPGSLVWRQSLTGVTVMLGFIPRPATPVTWTYGEGSTLTISSGDVAGGSNVGAYFAGFAGPYATDGTDQIGNAASNVLDDLNAYLASVLASRPAGPVTVDPLTTSATTPTLTGSVTLQEGETFSVIVNGVEYTTATEPGLVISGTTWSLTLTEPLTPGSYSVTATITNADGFTLADATQSEVTITGAELTVGGVLTANDKVYTGTTAATGDLSGLTLSGIASGDTVTIASATLAFGTATVGTDKTVTITSLTLGGPQASTYSVDLTGAPTATAAITPKPLTITGLSAASRIYNGTTTATLSGTAAYDGLENGESFSVTGTPTANFAEATVGTDKPVTVTGYTAPSANYTVTQPTGLTADITPKPLTIGGSFTSSDKPFDNLTTASLTTNSLTLVGVVGEDDVTLDAVTVAFATATIGTDKPVSITSATLGGSMADNYTLSLTGAPTTTADITAASVTVTGVLAANDKVYDRTTVATGDLSGLVLSGVVGEDDVSIASATLAFGTATVGTDKTVTITSLTLGGAQASSYAVNLTGAPTATAAITPKPLTIGGSFTALDKVFDGTTAATIGTNTLALVGVISNDDVSLTSVVAAFGTPEVGENKPVGLTGAGLAGSAAGNYALVLAAAPTTTAAITAAGAAPTAPTQLKGGIDNGRLTLDWNLPLDEGCGPVTGWIVEYRRQGEAAWARLTVTGREPGAITLPSLVNGAVYEIRVAAINACGVGPFANVGPLVPVAPTGPGVSRTMFIEVVEDTTVYVEDRGITLVLRALDTTRTAIPVDSTGTPVLEQGGETASEGNGFTPGTYVTLYLYREPGAPILLATVLVNRDGSFTATAPIDASIPPGRYTLEVQGVDAAGQPRTLAIPVEVLPPPPVLVLTAVPDETNPAVGDTISVTLTVTNTGTGPAIDVDIYRAFDEAGFRIIAATPRDGTYEPTTMRWRIPLIPAGGDARLLLTLIVLPPTAGGTTP